MNKSFKNLANSIAKRFDKLHSYKIALLLIILANIIIKWFILQSYPFADHEELCERRTIIKEIIENQNYKYLKAINTYNLGGGSLTVFLSVPFYALMGSSPISLHLVGIVFSSLSILIMYFLLKKHFGQSSAKIGGILLMLAPLTYTVYSLTSWGDHDLSFFFQILMVYLFFDIWWEKNGNDTKRKWGEKYFVVVGLVCALSVFVFLGSLFTLAFCLLFWFFVEHDSFNKKWFGVFLLSFLAFLSIGFMYMLTLKPDVVASFLKVFLDIGSNTDPLEKFYRLFSLDLPYSFYFDEYKYYNYDMSLSPLDIPKSYIYYSLFLLSFFFFLYRIFKTREKTLEIKNKYIFFLLYFISFALIFSMSSFDVTNGPIVHSHRYLIPFYFPIVVLLSLFINDLISRKHFSKYIGLFLSLIIFFIVFSANIKLINLGNWDKPDIFYRKSCYEYIYKKIKSNCENVNEKLYCLENQGWQTLHNTRDLNFSIGECAKLGNSAYCLEGVSKKLGMLGPNITLGTSEGEVLFWKDPPGEWEAFPTETYPVDFSKDMFSCDELEDCYKVFCYESSPMVWVQCKKDPIQLCVDLKEPYKSFCYTGIGRSMFHRNDVKCLWGNTTLCNLFYLGVGKEIAYLYSDEKQFFEACEYFSSQTTDLFPYCYRGLGWMVARKSLGNKTYALEECRSTGPYVDFCREGVSMYFG